MSVVFIMGSYSSANEYNWTRMLIPSLNVSISIAQRRINRIQQHQGSCWNKDTLCGFDSLLFKVNWRACHVPYPVRSFPQSPPGAGRRAAPDLRWGRRGWAGWCRSKASDGAWWLWTWHQGTVLCSSRSIARYVLLGLLVGNRIIHVGPVCSSALQNTFN